MVHVQMLSGAAMKLPRPDCCRQLKKSLASRATRDGVCCRWTDFTLLVGHHVLHDDDLVPNEVHALKEAVKQTPSFLYLPKEVDGKPVLQLERDEEWKVTNEFLRSHKPLLQLLLDCKKCEDSGSCFGVRWGSIVRGEDQSDGLLRLTVKQASVVVNYDMPLYMECEYLLQSGRHVCCDRKTIVINLVCESQRTSTFTTRDEKWIKDIESEYNVLMEELPEVIDFTDMVVEAHRGVV